MENNNNIQAYNRLAGQLDKSPLGAPKTPELMELLEELFTPEEAEAASRLSFKPVRAIKTAEQLGADPDQLGELLAGMAAKGLIYERVTERGGYYCLVAVVPGLVELQFMSGEDSPHKRRLAGLFDAYYRPGIGAAMVNAEIPYGRVIPVGRSLDNTQEILPYQQAENVIKAQEYIALATCYCRHEAELLGKGCGKPKDTCMIFGSFAEYIIDKGFAKAIDTAEALAVMEKSEQAGLVHVVDNVADGANFMCNCCGCCCLFLKTITELDSPGAVAQASFLAEVDRSECTQCEACWDICPVGAVTLPDGPAIVDPDRCLGCGQCQRACAFDAITMIPKDRPKPPANHGELMAALSRKNKPAA